MRVGAPQVEFALRLGFALVIRHRCCLKAQNTHLVGCFQYRKHDDLPGGSPFLMANHKTPADLGVNPHWSMRDSFGVHTAPVMPI